MTDVPALTAYHRWLGWHATAMRRAGTVLVARSVSLISGLIG